MKPTKNHESRTAKAWSKKVYLLPNLFTTANMFCGFLAVVMAIQGRFEFAAWIIIVGTIFDSMDGRVARMTRATSDFGVQYDSLSDLTSFGLAPAFLAYLWALQPFGRLGWLLAFLYTVCAALRLARFNVMVGSVPKGYFQGLPSPAAAVVVASGVLFFYEMKVDLPRHVFVLPITLTAATLMISSVRFPSFKEFRMNRENSFGVLALIVLVMTLIAVRPEVTIFLMTGAYVVLSLVVDAIRLALGRRPSVKAVGAAPDKRGPEAL